MRQRTRGFGAGLCTAQKWGSETSLQTRERQICLLHMLQLSTLNFECLMRVIKTYILQLHHIKTLILYSHGAAVLQKIHIAQLVTTFLAFQTTRWLTTVIRKSRKSEITKTSVSVRHIQGAPGGKVNILGDHRIGHSMQKSVYVHVSYCERFPR
jgi:hypothetical protein